jgi:hypothetical protein
MPFTFNECPFSSAPFSTATGLPWGSWPSLHRYRSSHRMPGNTRIGHRRAWNTCPRYTRSWSSSLTAGVNTRASGAWSYRCYQKSELTLNSTLGKSSKHVSMNTTRLWTYQTNRTGMAWRVAFEVLLERLRIKTKSDFSVISMGLKALYLITYHCRRCNLFKYQKPRS